jgi:DNA-binding protein WhiA
LRKQEHILYVKRENDILNFIKIIGAYTVYDELKKRKSAQKIVVTNMRLNNLEVSNIYKTAKASSVQIPIITEIIGTEEFEKSPEKFKIFCNMRIENPNSSYSDLVKNFKEEHNITITRAGLNHFMVKAKNIYDKIKKN